MGYDRIVDGDTVVWGVGDTIVWLQGWSIRTAAEGSSRGGWPGSAGPRGRRRGRSRGRARGPGSPRSPRTISPTLQAPAAPWLLVVFTLALPPAECPACYHHQQWFHLVPALGLPAPMWLLCVLLLAPALALSYLPITIAAILLGLPRMAIWAPPSCLDCPFWCPNLASSQGRELCCLGSSAAAITECLDFRWAPLPQASPTCWRIQALRLLATLALTASTIGPPLGHPIPQSHPHLQAVPMQQGHAHSQPSQQSMGCPSALPAPLAGPLACPLAALLAPRLGATTVPTFYIFLLLLTQRCCALICSLAVTRPHPASPCASAHCPDYSHLQQLIYCNRKAPGPMSRSTPWRNKPTPLITQMLPLAAELKLYLINEIGPTSFLFKDENENKFKVIIGDRLSCSCGVVDADHCIHTLYVMLKKYRVAENNALIWQASYLDSELEGLVQLKYMAKKKTEATSTYKSKKKATSAQQEAESEDFPPLGEDDTCPICYEDMAGQCYSTCGTCRKSIHSKCFKVWIKHKQDHGQPVTCPMCRAQFHNPMVQVLSDLDKWEKRFTTHKGTLCRGCGAKNIKGLVYRCLVCPATELCRLCYEGNQHIEHDRFFVKELSIQSWRLVPARVRKGRQQLFQAIKQFQARELPSDIHSFQFVSSLFPTLKEHSVIQGASQLGIVGNQMLMKQICYRCRKMGDDGMKRLHCGHSVHLECLRDMWEKQEYLCEVDQEVVCPGYCSCLGIKVKKSTKKSMVDATFVRSSEDAAKIRHKLEGETFGFGAMQKVQRLNQRRQGSVNKASLQSRDRNFRIMKKSTADKKMELEQQLGIGPMMVTGLGGHSGTAQQLHIVRQLPGQNTGMRNRTTPKPMQS